LTGTMGRGWGRAKSRCLPRRHGATSFLVDVRVGGKYCARDARSARTLHEDVQVLKLHDLCVVVEGTRKSRSRPDSSSGLSRAAPRHATRGVSMDSIVVPRGQLSRGPSALGILNRCAAVRPGASSSSSTMRASIESVFGHRTPPDAQLLGELALRRPVARTTAESSSLRPSSASLWERAGCARQARPVEGWISCRPAASLRADPGVGSWTRSSRLTRAAPRGSCSFRCPSRAASASFWERAGCARQTRPVEGWLSFRPAGGSVSERRHHDQLLGARRAMA